MALSLATIRVTCYTTLYNFLQTGTYAITSNNIHEYITENLVKKEGYPQVQLQVRTAENKLTFGSSGLYEIPITIQIETRHNSATNSKTLADEITNKIRTGKATLVAAGFHEIKFEFDDYDYRPYGTNHTEHRYILLFTATYRSAV